MRKPKAFISSTLLGLRYIRETIITFLDANGWSSLAFEENDIAWISSKKIDENCIRGVEECDILILVLGQHYGRSQAELSRYKKSISITEAEYFQAIEKGLQVYSFIEFDVLHDYRLWERNNFSAKFEADTDRRCLELLRTIKSDGLQFPIIGFQKAEGITNYLRNQWASILSNYYLEAPRRKEIGDLSVNVQRLERMAERLEEMLEFLIGESGNTNAQLLLNKNESLRSKELIQQAMRTLNRSNMLHYIERFCDLPSHEHLIEIVLKNLDLEDFLSSLKVPKDAADYVLDYQGSHQTYIETRNQIISLQKERK